MDKELFNLRLDFCKACRFAHGKEPDKCGMMKVCQDALLFGAAHEREECAKAIECLSDISEEAQAMAAVIRARGKA